MYSAIFPKLIYVHIDRVVYFQITDEETKMEDVEKYTFAKRNVWGNILYWAKS
jgi:hypothetical protein